MITTVQYRLDFGKHKGETINEVLKTDPSYILWLQKEKVLEFLPRIIKLAENGCVNNS